MQREIYEVTAKIIDANGAYNTLSGYPKAYDSKNYDNDLVRTRNRAFGEFYSVLGTMCTRDDRKLQIAMINRMSDGVQIALERVGDMPEVPDEQE